MVSVTPRPLSTPGKDPVPIVQEAGWAPGSVWTCAENLAPTRIRSPDRPARSQSLYRLSYPANNLCCYWIKIIVAKLRKPIKPSNLCKSLERTTKFHEFEPPKFQDNRHLFSRADRRKLQVIYLC
jgi:hypothetical protein